jgi:hypothetical protein
MVFNISKAVGAFDLGNDIYCLAYALIMNNVCVLTSLYRLHPRSIRYSVHYVRRVSKSHHPRLQLHNMYGVHGCELLSNVGVCELKLADLQPWDTSVAIFVQAHHMHTPGCMLKYILCLPIIIVLPSHRYSNI